MWMGLERAWGAGESGLDEAHVDAVNIGALLAVRLSSRCGGVWSAAFGQDVNKHKRKMLRRIPAGASASHTLKLLSSGS